MAKFKDAASRADLVGFFDCQGELSKGLGTVMRISPSNEDEVLRQES